MSWLTHLSGFQLFVVFALLDITSWQAHDRWVRDRRWPSALSLVTNGMASIVVWIVWFTHAVWPAIS